MEEYEMIEPTYVKAVQIGDDIAEILQVPCIISVDKQLDEFYPYVFHLSNGVVAVKGDWLVWMGERGWKVVPDSIFRQRYKKRTT